MQQGEECEPYGAGDLGIGEGPSDGECGVEHSYQKPRAGQGE